MGMEGMPEFGRARRIEGNLELNRLRRVIEAIVVPGAGKSELEELLALEPQRDEAGNLRYLVTSGMAVELITGYEREHHDLDLVIMDPANTNYYWEIYGTDNVTPQRYWADMRFDPDFLTETVRDARTRGNHGPLAEVVHPAILMVQKSSNAWDRPPRPKDNADVGAIVRHWREKEGYTRQWNPIVRTSLDALPPEQVDRTLKRILAVVK